jgi:cobalt-zinc-cadmium efflux system membrane fusion protein
MLGGIRKSFLWIAGQVPTVLTLAVLGALAYWGATNDWKVPRFFARPSPEPEEHAEDSVRVITERSSTQSGTDSFPFAAKLVQFPDAEAVEKAGIQTVPVGTRTLAKYVEAHGTIDYEPSLYARLTARATGTIWRLQKEAGDPVRKGEILAIIDSAEVGKVKADLLSSLTQLRVRTALLQQLESAGNSGAVSQRALRDADSSLREARIRLFNDQQALLNFGLPLRLKDIENLPEDQLVRHLRLLGLPEDLRKQLDPETLTANLLPLVAPFDGQVVQRFAALGELQQMNQPKPVYTVADIRRLHFEVDVNPQDVGLLQIGQLVTFRREGENTDAASGRLSHISPEIDEKTRRVRVHAEFENADGRLRPNTFGSARIRISEHANAPVVPIDAVQSEGENHFVLVRAAPTSFRPKLVQPGLREGNWLEVQGVKPGEEVVTAGSFLLKSELSKEKIEGGND